MMKCRPAPTPAMRPLAWVAPRALPPSRRTCRTRPLARRRLTRLGRSHLHLVRLVLMSQCEALETFWHSRLKAAGKKWCFLADTFTWAVLAHVTLLCGLQLASSTPCATA